MTTSDAGIGGTGYGIADLADYLDRGRTPYDPVIESDPACLAALDRIERVRAVGRDLRDTDEFAVDADDRWAERVLADIGREVRAGRDVPLDVDGADRFAITEGALRGIVRGAVDDVDGVLLGRCRFRSDFAIPDTPVDVDLTISVAPGVPMPAIAERVRQRVLDALRTHTRLDARSVDVTITAIHDGGAA